jgi:hypothetical protein
VVLIPKVTYGTEKVPQPKSKKIYEIKCPMCGEVKSSSRHYKSNSPLYVGLNLDNPDNQGVMVFCKECIWSTYDTYYSVLEDIKKCIIITCMKFDIPFNEGDYNGTIKEYINKPNAHPMKIYMTKINSLGNINNALLGFDPKFLFDKDTGKDLITNALELEAKDLDYNVQLTEQDLQIKDDVTRLIGYNPFEGYSNFDQRFLYNELITYLDEDLLDDAFKLSQVLQLVNNNNQIRKIDLVISNLSNDAKTLVANQGEIKSLTDTKNKIVTSTDKIAKENSISVKNRGDKSAGKSTLSYLMKQYRELNFEDAEQDYYDQNKAYGMKITADISNKSLLEQLQLDENDYTDMINTQRQLVQEFQSRIEDLEEENRQLNVLIDKYNKSPIGDGG